MAWDESGAKIIPKCILWMRGLVPFWVLRHSFRSLTDCWWLYNIQLKTSRGVLLLPSSDAYVRSFLYLPYTLIKLYYTKALSDPASSLAPDWIRLLRRPRIPVSYRSATTFQYHSTFYTMSMPFDFLFVESLVLDWGNLDSGTVFSISLSFSSNGLHLLCKNYSIQ